MKNTRRVVQSSETEEVFVDVGGLFMEVNDYIDGGRAEAWDYEIMGEQQFLGFMSDHEIAEEYA